MATVEDWNTYAQEAQDNLERVRGEVREKINDPNTSTADRNKAIIDLETQEHYVNWVQEQNDQIQQTGVIPSTMSIDSWSAGSGIWQDGQGKYRPARFINEPVAGNQQRIGTTYTQNVADLDGNVISFRAMVTNTPSSSAVNFFRIKKVEYNSQNGYLSEFSMLAWDNEWHNTWKWQFGTADSYKEQTVPSSWSSFYRYACISGCLTNESINPPVHTAFNNLCGVGDWDLVDAVTYITLFKIVGEAEITGGDVDPDAPWDFFNDNINPDIDPDNSIFPGGYEPESSDTPSPEPTGLPHDDGEIPPDQRDREIILPYNFITQYALTADELSTVGTNLWQSWLTTNTDVWKNFYLPYAQDFGTLNIAACMDYIISLKIFPFEFTEEVTIPSPFGVRMGTGHTDFLGFISYLVNTQIYALYAGKCKVVPKIPYNDFRDIYNTSVIAVLPYCGLVELNPAEVINRTVNFWYYIDFQSGSCTAVVSVDGDAGEYNVASKTGQIGYTLPMTATNAGQLAATYAKDATEIAKTLAGFYFDVGESIASSIEGFAKTFVGRLASDSDNKESIPGGFNTVASSTKIGKSGVDTALSLTNKALDVLSRSGVNMPYLSGGGNAESFLFADRPYVQIRRGKYAKPLNYPHSQAHLNGSSGTISDYAGKFGDYPSENNKGLCKFTGIDTSGLTCHDDERAEIVSILESGVYI